jgi:hypothetical protein
VQSAEPVRVRRGGRSGGVPAERVEAPSVDGAGLAAVGRLVHGGGPAPPSMVARMAAAAGNAAAATLVQRSAGLTAQGAGPLDSRTAAAIDAERGRGSPLADPVRSDMEQHLGADLRAVRVHTGPTADTLNRAVTAKAFTTGTDVFFSSGRFDPTSPAGRELLAHELTHVAQQAHDPGAVARVSHEHDPAEVEARAVARSVAQGAAAPPDEPAPVREAAGSSAVGVGVVARDPWHKEAPTGTGRAGGPIGSIQIGLRQISSDPQVARQQLRDIAVKDGPQEAQRVLNEIRFRRAQLQSQRHETWEAQDPIYLDLVTALDGELKHWNRFEVIFKETAENKTKQMLAFSRQRVEAEVSRYGLTDKRGSGGFGMAANRDTEAMATAARELAAEMARLEAVVTGYEARRRGAERRGLGVAAHPMRVQVHQAEQRYLVMRNQKEAEFPILASFAGYKSRSPDALRAVRRRLEAVGRSVADEHAVEMVAGDAFEKLRHIAEVEAALKDKSLNIWAADNVVALTKKEFGIAKGSLEDRIIDQQVRDDASEKNLRNMLFSAFALALGLLAAPLVAGGALVAGVVAGAGGVAVSAGMTIEHLQEYQLGEAANATDFDKARVLSSDEPSLFWLALDIISTLIDVGGTARAATTVARTAFKQLAPTARAAINASDEAVTAALDSLERSAATTIPEAPSLGKTVREAAEQERLRLRPDQTTVRAEAAEQQRLRLGPDQTTVRAEAVEQQRLRLGPDQTTVREPAPHPATDSVPPQLRPAHGPPIVTAHPITVKQSFSTEGISDAERAMLDRPIVGPPQPLGGSGNVNATYTVPFADRTRGVYKPIGGEAVSIRGQPIRQTIRPGTQAYREVAASRLDEVLGFDLVPPTTLRQDGGLKHGPGSMQQFVPSDKSLPVNRYPEVQRERMAVLDYIIGNTDRHIENYRTVSVGQRRRLGRGSHRPVAIDHGYSFPGGPADPIRSDFVGAYLGRNLSPEVVKAVRAADPNRVRDVLRSSGLEDDAIEGALHRLREVQANGKITGESWRGRIIDAEKKTIREELP